jgi:hypothetical protein
MEESTMQVFEDRLPRRIFGLKCEERKECWEEFQKFSDPLIILYIR